MHPLLRFTLDLFGPDPGLTPVVQSTRDVEHFRHPQASREVRLGDALVAYEFKRGQRRSIGFSVGPHGLAVRAPKWVPLHEVEAALQEKSAWILRKLQESRERHALLAEHTIAWRDGARLPFLGRAVVLKLDPEHGFAAAGAELMAADAGAATMTLRLSLPNSASPGQIRDVVQAWLMRQSKRVFQERLDHFAPLLGVQWTKMTLSNAGTRWGSARVDGSIRLNWRLVHFSMAVIDYVVAHELSHLREMNHGPRFWDTVQSVVPDYAALRRQLKDEPAPRWA
ncbi:SprT family zinc-dependent metalloprotease [Rhodoferax sp.]|uniref:M48 family metallopeptidase n=1 Tax=Rhodoferax sp. TaxID=50421 RepID=UPI0026032A7D|nr:SprT family zinc-dependent metalloprotease [Rhodoferax sp.]MDD2919710.1 SprT family zinc-dependent metalloprotease [Rhodoferax sp.]